jgi:6,7-dimethyl-8-ribityllumazine synthase
MLQGNHPDRKVIVAVVTARFNDEVTYKLEAGALKALESKGLKSDQILQIRVPGAFEIPLAAKYCIDKGVDAVIALGAVIRGETSHYDYVCSAVERGCTNLQTEYAVPVAFGILTTDNEEQAMDRAGGRHGNKGEEAALVALEMLDLKDKINKG